MIKVTTFAKPRNVSGNFGQRTPDKLANKMVRESKIKELTNEKVVTLIDQELNKYGFKYLKSKGHFIRQDCGFNQIVSIYTPSSPLVYDEDTEQILLTFNVSSRIEIPEYEKWHLEKLGEKTHFSYGIDKLTSQIELSFNDFDSESFFKPTDSQRFKRSITLSIMGGSNRHKDIIPLSDLLNTSVSNIVLKLKENSNILQIHKNREYSYQYIYLLLFSGYQEMAYEELNKYYEYLLSEIEAKINLSEMEASSYIGALNRLIRDSQKVTTLSFNNPYKRSVKISDTKNDYFEFSQKTKLSEILRLDISQFEIKTVNINSTGDILLFANSQKIIKLNHNGKLVFEQDIETKKGFDKIFWGVPSGIVNGTKNFFVNNYIIKDDNTILELPLPVQKLKKGKLQNPHISDFAFCEKTNKYLIIYEDNFITYNIGGQVEKTINVGEKFGSKIIVEKKWIITQKRDKANIILDFEGNTIATYEFGNGNNKFEFSTNYEQLICFFYSTKSQFYDLTNGKKGTLWAHPTFIKDYKETMYNDIENNFGMTVAKFSPDNKYIVGGAYHGKYVAWTLPKLERTELIPQDEMIELLEPLKSSWSSNGEREETITKAQKITLDNQVFLKNRRNDMSKIFFFENGDIFVTELGYEKFVLSWDRNFSNLTYKKTEGRLDLHADKYLTQRTKTELTIYRQE